MIRPAISRGLFVGLASVVEVDIWLMPRVNKIVDNLVFLCIVGLPDQREELI